MIFFLLTIVGFANDASDFPEGKGRDLVVSTCTRCHSGKLVRQNRLDRERWDKTIIKMQQHGLWDLEAADKKEILDYLEAHFSSKVSDPVDGLGPRATNPLPN